jgi:hypothetical protein
MSEQVNSNQDDLSLEFHNWKYNNKISKLFFECLSSKCELEIERLTNLAYSNKSDQDKLIYLGGHSAVIKAIYSILNTSYEDGEIVL